MLLCSSVGLITISLYGTVKLTPTGASNEGHSNFETEDFHGLSEKSWRKWDECLRSGNPGWRVTVSTVQWGWEANTSIGSSCTIIVQNAALFFCMRKDGSPVPEELTLQKLSTCSFAGLISQCLYATDKFSPTGMRLKCFERNTHAQMFPLGVHSDQIPTRPHALSK